MPTAKKLPSGSWRCQVFSHFEEVVQPDGTTKKKRIYESFTSTNKTLKGKKEAELAAAKFEVSKQTYQRPDSISLGSAVDSYIDSKRKVLSPSTVNSYLSIRKHHFNELGRISLRDLSNEQIQMWVSQLSADHSPKTVRNAFGLLSATLDMFYPDFRLKVTLPQKKKPDLYVPTDADIKRLLQHIEGKELEIAVLLAAFGPLRRGEICALTSDDISGTTVTISKSMVLNADGEWEIKPPKTYSGYRTIEFPQFVIDRMSGIEGRIVKATPNQITSRFQRAVRFSHVPHFRFHDLRHYSASVQHAIGIPDQYIMQRGGWSSDSVLKSIYRGAMDDQSKKFNQIAVQHFEHMQHEMQHENKICRK